MFVIWVEWIKVPEMVAFSINLLVTVPLNSLLLSFGIQGQGKKMSKPRFTIITVCYNAEKYITETIQSVLQQTFSDYEYIIEDGFSTDSTLKLVASLAEGNERINVFSMPDNGIYDAMNKALEQAEGEYIFFLNAGDCFCNNEVLSKAVGFFDSHNADIAYGNIVEINGEEKSVRKYGNIYRKKFFYLTGDCICHQAIFAKHELFLKREFDTKYKICADRDWQLFWIDKKAAFSPMFFEVATVLSEGFSRSHIEDYEKEVKTCINQYFGKLEWVYGIISIMKNNIMLLKILRYIERKLFKK